MISSRMLSDRQQLVDRRPAAVAGVAANLAADARKEVLLLEAVGAQARLDELGLGRPEALLAPGAEHAHQALGEDAVEPRRQVVGLDPHVQEAPGDVR